MQIFLVLSFGAILLLVVASVQNSIPIEVSLFAWSFETTLTKVIAGSGALGALIPAALLLPRLFRKQLAMRRLRKALAQEKKRSVLARPASGQPAPGRGRQPPPAS